MTQRLGMTRTIEVNVYKLVLQMEKRTVNLTKSVARQLPILDGALRWRAAEQGLEQPEPICKVLGRILGQAYKWMYLVEDPEAGLGWVAATQCNEQMAKAIVRDGGWVDKPKDVPTAIL